MAYNNVYFLAFSPVIQLISLAKISCIRAIRPSHFLSKTIVYKNIFEAFAKGKHFIPTTNVTSVRQKQTFYESTKNKHSLKSCQRMCFFACLLSTHSIYLFYPTNLQNVLESCYRMCIIGIYFPGDNKIRWSLCP